jgi:hypothetical protein
MDMNTTGTFDRVKAREVLYEVARDAIDHYEVPSSYDPPNYEGALDLLAGCVVEDPRLARIATELDRHESETNLTRRGEEHLARLRAILGGGSA